MIFRESLLLTAIKLCVYPFKYMYWDPAIGWGWKYLPPCLTFPCGELLGFRTHCPNMAPCYIEYLYLKESEKWQGQERLSDLPLRQVIAPMWGDPSLDKPEGKMHPSFPRQRNTQKKPNRSCWVPPPPICYTGLTLFVFSYSTRTVPSA